MKKSLILVHVFALLAVAVYAVVAVVFFFNDKNKVGAADEVLPDGIYTVTFDSREGTAVDSQQVASGNKVKEPKAPSRSGCNFLGWYSDVACEQIFHFDTPITNSITLYAKWETVYYTITFDVRGGAAIAPKTVVSGTKIKAPTPVWEGFEFIGWFSDEDCTTPFDFTKPIDSDKTLYAKWSLELKMAEDGLSYIIDKYNGDAENVVLPATYNGLPVTAIGAFAFKDCATVKSIIISGNIKTIEDGAFENCSTLTTIIIEDGIIYIGDRVFERCNCLTSIVISESVEVVGKYIFKDCNNLATIYCEIDSRPAGWNANWNKYCNAKVVFGYQG